MWVLSKIAMGAFKEAIDPLWEPEQIKEKHLHKNHIAQINKPIAIRKK